MTDVFDRNDPHDHRYDHVRCSACGGRYQRIDWGSAIHRMTCSGFSTATQIVETSDEHD